MNKKWIINKKAPQEFINQFPEFHPVVLQLLYNRNLTAKKEIDQFLNPDYQRDILDPYLFKDMKKAVKRIGQAIEKEERIVIHGDYDADGVCGSVILFDTLKILGAKVNVYLPHREREGYGMNKETVKELANQGVGLIITTDCGISNKKEIALANSYSVDVIVTDHHEPPSDLPPAHSILDPRLAGESYPYKDLAGSGVAFKLACALIKESRKDPAYSFSEGFEKWLLDMVAISTVTDVVPLRGENRTLLKYGLIVLQKTKRLGLQALLESINNRNRKIDTFTIGFQIGPRINAAGRMDHANLAFRLLTAESEKEAEELARELQLNNQQRQRVTDSLVQEVKAQLGDFDEKQKMLFAVGQKWPAGVIGLVAGKMADEFYRPVLILTEQDGKVTGSGRSIREFNIVRALEKTQIYFEHWGGHSQACGFTLKRIEYLEKFRSDFQKIAEEELKEAELNPFLEIDKEVELKEVDWDLYEALDKFNPFGEKNPKPLFAAFKAKVQGWQKVGENGQHLKLMVTQNSHEIRKTIGFRIGEFANNLAIGDLVDIAFEVGMNEWNGNQELELKIVDIRKSQKNEI